MKKQGKMIIAAITLFIMLPLMIVPTSANSALTEWEGKDANGVVTTDENCPIVVEHEKLTFNINELPDPDPVADTNGLNSSVTAEYTFYNPSDTEITAKLAFPFTIINSTNTDVSDERYSITVNGEIIESEIRHTLYTKYYSGYEFDVNEDIPRLVDDYVKDDYYNDDLTITKYTVQITLTDDRAYRWAFDINPDEYPNTNFYIPSADYTQIQENGDLRVYGILNFSNGQKDIDVYAFGEAKGLPKAKYYTHSSWTGGEVEEVKTGRSEIVASEKVNFTDFVFENYDENSGISRMDWYNATVHRLQSITQNKNYLHFARFGNDYQEHFMCWYYYDITIGAGERIVNSVTAPMIPGTNIRYNPPKYSYSYLISPAATWMDFGTLDIIINTPYYLIQSNIDGFEKTENGYELHLDGLPREKDKYKLTLNGIEKEKGKVKDLTFKLSEAEKPESKNKLSVGATILIIIGLIICLPLVIVGAVIYGIVYLVQSIIKN